jgi:Ser/Thr protein kinase RdoA (MazF antagonist)
MNVSSSSPAVARHPYEGLTPDKVLSALESLGLETDGRMLALNSYENRVYQVGLETGGFVVAKFYRPARWSDQSILEEHAFSRELAEAEIPVIAPLVFANGRTLNEYAGFRLAVFPRRGGRWPELDDPEVLRRLGRFLGRIHALGATRLFEHRPTLDLDYGEVAYRFILDNDFVPADYLGQFRDLGRRVLERVGEALVQAGSYTRIRVHGDFHPGNILWTQDGGAHLVDTDDCRNGPAVQDLWMLLSGERHERIIQLSDLLEGYEEFCDFDRRELHLIEPLRALRIVHYAGWLARRWSDPAFPRAFPWFNTPRYWEEQVLTLRHLLQDLDRSPIG